MNDTLWVKALLPLIAAELILMATALISLAKAEEVTGGKKWVWALIIICIQTIGPILYFVIGRKGERTR